MKEPRESSITPRQLASAYDRILTKIEYDTVGGCWLWTGAVAGTYGHVRIRPHITSFAAHRIAYWAEKGPIPAGLKACHRCDIRICCNPAHVFLGTQSENLQDASRKGRLWMNKPGAQRTGERHPRATLTDEDVRAILSLHRDGFHYVYLAKLFGSSEGNIMKIISGRARLRG